MFFFFQVYGWSLPADSQSSAMVPVPVCCRPLMDNQPSLKVWCATGVTLRGGKDKEGKYIIGQPVYFSSSAKKVSKSTKNGGKHELEDEISVRIYFFWWITITSWMIYRFLKGGSQEVLKLCWSEICEFAKQPEKGDRFLYHSVNSFRMLTFAKKIK